MTDAQIAYQRLSAWVSAWVRDYGGEKAKVFVGDLTLILMVARGSLFDQEKPERPTEQQLIDAMNLFCECVSKRLRPGWTLALKMDSREAFLTLKDEDGVDHNDIHDESDVSGITSRIEYAKEYDTQE